MGQQVLRTVISIGGRVDNSFGQIGDQLIVLGSQFDQLSQKVIKFGKESLMTYASYDDAMREAQAAGKFTAQQMQQLDKLNREIAQTTIYSNTEAASAMAELVKRGYDLKQVEEMLPAVLNLAMAGNLDLANSVNYLGSALKALKEDSEYAGTFVDMMARASDISAADINTLGDSITRLGSGIDMFRGGAKEALTLMTLLSDYGEDMQGTEGGTALRNMALSLIAPAGQNGEVLAALENFGMSTEELNAYMEEEGITATAAAAAIDGLGLKVFDADGKLRNMHDILVDLKAALLGLPDEERIPVLRSIFGKRGYTTIENLMDSLPKYAEVYEEIANSMGAADARADIMQGGIGGEMREFAAAYEEFKTSIGEQVAPEAESVIDWLGDFVSSLSNMDETKLAALVGAGEGLALAGPGLLAAGAGMKLVGSLGTKGAAIMLAALGLGAAVSALQKAQELDFEGNFGLMEIDQEAINEKLNGLSAALEAQTADYNEYRDAVTGAVTAYTEASATLSGELLTAAITGTALTETDKQRLLGLGNEMYTQLVSGITNSSAASMEYMKWLFGSDGDNPVNDPEYQDMITVLDYAYNDALATAKEQGQALRDALTAAFEDGEITDEEYKNILATYQSMNEAMARAENEAASRQAEIERMKMLDRAGEVSFDSAEATLSDIQGAREAAIAPLIDDYLNEKYGAQLAWDKAIADGLEMNGELATEERRDRALADIDLHHQPMIDAMGAQYDEMYRTVFDTLISQSGYADIWAAMQALDAFKGASPDEIARFMAGAYSEDQLAQMDKLASNGRILGLLTGASAGGNSVADAYLDIIDMVLLGVTDAQQLIQQSLMTGQGIGLSGEGESGFDLPGPEYFGFEQMEDGKYALPPLTARVNMPDGGEEISPVIAAAQAYADSNPVSVGVDFRPRNHTLTLPGMNYDTYAEGGRATEASIFGEAGAEWAIPEQYSQNTADLLNAARQASGFSWPDLINRTSGGGGQGKAVQLVYSPTIYAIDARDVEQKLADDKARMERWLKENALRDEIEVYR